MTNAEVQPAARDGAAIINAVSAQANALPIFDRPVPGGAALASGSDSFTPQQHSKGDVLIGGDGSDLIIGSAVGLLIGGIATDRAESQPNIGHILTEWFDDFTAILATDLIAHKTAWLKINVDL